MAYLDSCNNADLFVQSPNNIDRKTNKKMLEKLSGRITAMSMNYTVSRNFPLKEEMKIVVEGLFESGIRGKWRKDFAEENFNQTLKIGESEESSLTLTDLRIPFIVLVIGYALALLVFVIEFVVGQCLRFYRHIANLAHP